MVANTIITVLTVNINIHFDSGSDFLLLQTTFVFDSNKINESVPFQVYNDDIGELPEYFHLDLTCDTRGVVLGPEITIYIINGNDII